MDERPNCLECSYLREIPGDCHSKCANTSANVEGHSIGIKGGWFMWPYNFDPNWLLSCDGYTEEVGEDGNRTIL